VLEARVWLTDVARLSNEDAMAMMRWSAQALPAAALTGQAPPTRAISRRPRRR
jgi:hypothetical protein